MKILLVSDVHHFSTKDMFDGYVEAFKKLNIDFEFVELHNLINFSSIVNMTLEGAFGMIMAKMLNVDNEFTHILFISGLIVPDWLLKSKYDKKIGVIASDDPHASKILLDKFKYFDYYFTNEKNMEDKDNNILYLPTATGQSLPVVSKDELEEQYNYDVLFVGTVYKNREAGLEKVCEYCESKGLKVGIFGPLLNVRKDSIIRRYAKDGVIDNKEAKLLYRGSKIILNMDRNIEWNPIESEGNSLLVDHREPYSINPRAYEIAGCRSVQLYINARKEAHDIFGDNIYYANEDNVSNVIDQIIHEPKEVILNKINNCFEIVKKEHFYIHRANKLLNFIKTKETNND